MHQIDKFRTVPIYGDISQEDEDLINRVLPRQPENIQQENREIREIIPEFDQMVTIYENRKAWVWQPFRYARLLFGFEGARGYLLVYDLGTKQTLKDTWFGPMVKTESRLLILHRVDDLSYKHETIGKQGASIGGWVMDRPGPAHAHMEVGKDYKIDQPISYIEPSGDHAIIFDWILGDRLEPHLLAPPGRIGFVIPKRTGRWAFQGSFWFWRRQLKIRRLYKQQSRSRRFWTFVYHIPFWLLRMDGMTTDYRGHPKLLTKAQLKAHDALAQKYGWD